MKLFLVCLFMAITSIGFAQKEKHAYLPEFKKSENRWKSTKEKIKADIVTLNDSKIRQEIKKKQLEYFSISIVFIVDDKGNIITNDIRFLSEIESIKVPAIKYISELPAFVPKKASDENNNEVYFIMETYIVETGSLNFHKAEKEELKQKSIKPTSLQPDEYASYPGCGQIKEGSYDCVIGKLREIFAKNIVISPSMPSGTTKAHVQFTINTNGTIEITEIISDSNEFKREIRRIFKKLPEMVPSKVSNIPMSSSFGLPLSLNLK